MPNQYQIFIDKKRFTVQEETSLSIGDVASHIVQSCDPPDRVWMSASSGWSIELHKRPSMNKRAGQGWFVAFPDTDLQVPAEDFVEPSGGRDLIPMLVPKIVRDEIGDLIVSQRSVAHAQLMP